MVKPSLPVELLTHSGDAFKVAFLPKKTCESP